ncbi:hypothetical protein [Streptosporangium sp. NBC_01756]|uniref:hypothetical protein n=1 Tax=Streptosporangium sp. NBC_01756 TaxID=2975950 RepID=UPI002DD8ADCF|nr:hypothetical protein [Streptosporangium sp. NBC_01756]WSC87880.1 hypothetical protein OIE48_06620 [Streptosporangium sp. NBC_01756]
MDAIELANQAMPYVTAAIGAYGLAVLTKTQDLVADESVNLGRRLLQRFINGAQNKKRIEAAVEDVTDTPDDEDSHAALRGQLKRALAADPDLLKDIAEMLRNAGGAVIAGNERSQIVNANLIGGDNLQIGEARDITFRRR